MSGAFGQLVMYLAQQIEAGATLVAIVLTTILPFLPERLVEQPEKIMIVVGFAGQGLFAMRFIIQWLSSEKQAKSVIPIAFWYFSIGGGSVLFLYAIWRQDLVFMSGQGLGLFNPLGLHLHGIEALGVVRAGELERRVRSLQRRGWARPREVEAVVGKFTHIMLLHRPVLSVFSSVYAFARKVGGKVARVWPSVLRELDLRRGNGKHDPLLLHHRAIAAPSMVTHAYPARLNSRVITTLIQSCGRHALEHVYVSRTAATQAVGPQGQTLSIEPAVRGLDSAQRLMQKTRSCSRVTPVHAAARAEFPLANAS